MPLFSWWPFRLGLRVKWFNLLFYWINWMSLVFFNLNQCLLCTYDKFFMCCWCHECQRTPDELFYFEYQFQFLFFNAIVDRHFIAMGPMCIGFLLYFCCILFAFVFSLGCIYLCSHLPCTFDGWVWWMGSRPWFLYTEFFFLFFFFMLKGKHPPSTGCPFFLRCGWILTEWIFSFTLVTTAVGNRSHILVDRQENR